MDDSDFNLDLFIRSFEKAGVKIEKKDSGGIEVNGSVSDAKGVLESFFTRTTFCNRRETAP